jgi:hypothetical protein
LISVNETEGLPVNGRSPIGARPRMKTLSLSKVYRHIEPRPVALLATAPLVRKYNVFVVEVPGSTPAQKNPKTVHHHGCGTFVVDAPAIGLKSKMR